MFFVFIRKDGRIVLCKKKERHMQFLLKIFSSIKELSFYILRLFLVGWIRYVSFFSRFPGYFLLLPFPFLFLWTVFDPSVLLCFSILQTAAYFGYLTVVMIFNLGSLALYTVHQSPFREPITDFLGGGRFLFDLLGSPDPKYGNTRDHLFRVYVVPALTIGVVISVHLYRVLQVVLNTLS